MITGRIFGIAIIYALMTSHAFGMEETELSGTGSAMEGDVVSVKGTMIRLRGIDAPDPGQICRTMRGVNMTASAPPRLSFSRCWTWAK